MPGSQLFQGSQPIEYVEESTFATAESDGAYNWIGYVTDASVTEMPEVQIERYLPDDAGGVDLQRFIAEKISEMHELELSFIPQNDTFFQYWTGADGSLSNTLTSIQIGVQDRESGEFRRYAGCTGEELTITISEDSFAECTGTFIVPEIIDDSTTDYIGTGSHATEDTSAPLTYDDLGNVQWGGAALNDAIESLTLTISNDLQIVKDPDATPSSHVEAIVPQSREITPELSVTYDDFSMMRDIRSFTKQDLTFDWPESTPVSWTVADTAFEEAPYAFGPEDLVADTLTSVPATNLTYA